MECPLSLIGGFLIQGRLLVGNLLIINSLLWTFKVECKETTKDTVIWEFKEGPLKGNEYWKIDSRGGKCRILILNKTPKGEKKEGKMHSV